MTTNYDKRLGAARKRAGRLAKKLIAASEDFKAIAGLPPGAECQEVHRAIQVLTAAAVPWLRASFGQKRKPRPKRSFSVVSGWVGCGD